MCVCLVVFFFFLHKSFADAFCPITESSGVCKKPTTKSQAGAGLPVCNNAARTLMLPSGSHSKESTCNAGDLGLIPGSGRSPGEGYSNPLQYSCLENSMDRGAWQATVHRVPKSGT